MMTQTDNDEIRMKKMIPYLSIPQYVIKSHSDYKLILADMTAGFRKVIFVLQWSVQSTTLLTNQMK